MQDAMQAAVRVLAAPCPPVMPALPALLPLRHAVFRSLWTANVITALGTWMQNTGAGWRTTSLSPNALSVSLIQAATITPALLLALPAGALADMLDRRRFLIATQTATMAAASVLAGLTYAGLIDAAGLIALTFAIGVGSAMYQPAWGATVPEVVPRQDLVQAIALNGIGFNLARALGPALGGVLVLFGGPALAFSLYAVSFLAGIAALLAWRRTRQSAGLPRERLLSAMRAGLRFTRHNPAMQAAMLRAVAFFLPWALLRLVVRAQLGLGAGSFGVLLGLMGVGGVASGLLLPTLRGGAPRCSAQACSPAPAWRASPAARIGRRPALAWCCSASAGWRRPAPCRQRHSWQRPLGPRPGAGHLPIGVQRGLGVRLDAVGLARHRVRLAGDDGRGRRHCRRPRLCRARLWPGPFGRHGGAGAGPARARGPGA